MPDEDAEFQEIKLEDGTVVRGKRVKFPMFEIYEMTTINLKDLRENGIDAFVTHERRNDATGKMEVVSRRTIRSAVDGLEKLLPDKPAPDSVLGNMIGEIRKLDDKN
jgi:hypothetical protein